MAERSSDEPPAPLHRLGLTDRQAEIMGLVAEALSTKQIALRLGISPRTVDKHIEGALRALGADSRLAAANLIRQAGHPGPVNP
jgi:DNA-binding NarL/FixJ family response regulator